MHGRGTARFGPDLSSCWTLCGAPRAARPPRSLDPAEFEPLVNQGLCRGARDPRAQGV